MRLHRPHIPLEVRCRVALRQLGHIPESAETVLLYHRKDPLLPPGKSGYGRLLKILFMALAAQLGCKISDLRLDHNPALGLRKFSHRIQRYKPDANDPAYLLYRTKQDHHIKTNVRGDGAQRSDTTQMKRERRRLRKKKPRFRVGMKVTGSGFPRGGKIVAIVNGKRRWPKSRKIKSRGFDKRKRRLRP